MGNVCFHVGTWIKLRACTGSVVVVIGPRYGERIDSLIDMPSKSNGFISLHLHKLEL